MLEADDIPIPDDTPTSPPSNDPILTEIDKIEDSPPEVISLLRELYIRQWMLEKTQQDLIIARAGRDARVDERMNNIIKQLQETHRLVGECSKRLSAMSSFSNIIMIGSSIFASIIINVVNHLLK